MNTLFKRQSVLLSVTALAQLTAGFALFGGTLSAQAETIDTGSKDARATFATNGATSATPAPIPGTTATSSAALTHSDINSQAGESTETVDEVAQIDVDVDPGQPTRGGSSYIGVAGNLGLGGETALGEGSFMVISKIGFTRAISARPSVAIEDDPVILLPVTYDFPRQPTEAFEERFPVAPYVGAGIAIETSDDAGIGPLLTAGVDVPLNPQFTATAAVNAAFLDETDIGISIGVGYNFNGL
jgi:hypothetical protein